MGWWKLQDTNDAIGDGPLDALGDAAAAVVAMYEEAFGRKPTKAEWEALLRTVLRNEMPQFRYLDEGVVTSVVLELK